jgi:hypothetical protein
LPSSSNWPVAGSTLTLARLKRARAAAAQRAGSPGVARVAAVVFDDAVVAAAALALRDRVDETARERAAAADPEQHETAAHQERERDVDDLDRPAAA